jgi:lipoprotein-releasing system ATP-binding protein
MNQDLLQAKPLLLEAIDLHKSFYYPHEVNILKGIDLKVRAGESAAIVGRSGEGKSTLLQILGTLEDSCKGQLKISNQLVNNSNKCFIRNRLIGFVFQSFHLLEDYTALENVLMPARIARKGMNRTTELRGMELLEKVGLGSREHFHTKLLSGGEKQRVALARAMCNDPDIIFADEPSGNLDGQTANIIHEILLDFVKEGKALILVTHDWNLARLCTNQYELKAGRLEAVLSCSQ